MARTGAEGSVLRMSRRAMLAAVGATAVGAAAPAGAERTQSTVWPLYQYDDQNTGHAASVQGPRGAAGARWGFTEGGSVTATPVVTGDTVYVADEGADVVRALHRGTGEQRWQADVAVDTTRMTYHAGQLLVPGDDLVALSPSDGSELWSAGVPSPSSVAVDGDYAYLTASDGVYRVTLTGQAVDWHNDRLNQLVPAVAVTSEYVYAAGEQYGQVIALDPASGGRRWLARVDGTSTGAPTKADGGGPVLAPADGALVAISQESGLTDWTFDEGISSSVAVADGTVYATTTGGDVVAIDLNSGEERWRASPTPSSNPPVLAGGLLYVTGDDGTIAALDPNSGSVAWQSRVGDARSSNVAVGAGELYVGDEDGAVAAVAAGATGGLQETTPTPDDAPTDTPEPAAGGDDAERSPTAAESPGFGLGTGAAALGGGALAARRWIGDDEGDD